MRIKHHSMNQAPGIRWNWRTKETIQKAKAPLSLSLQISVSLSPEAVAFMLRWECRCQRLFMLDECGRGVQRPLSAERGSSVSSISFNIRAYTITYLSCVFNCGAHRLLTETEQLRWWEWGCGSWNLLSLVLWIVRVGRFCFHHVTAHSGLAMCRWS